ncbi:Retrovirus-related Pol polyprotein from transposon TNT 1-94 [Gossypium australe]|uniref:Retrovirus-related Pol polyprotein from transposon TNT 1-94 n=1 Tax=Gossypium australe TaxID=47621 RepID=A0A5B6W6R0_9ROSI|nr:Retrovirus-related Pol polyprotein from transposon TNT 1-94 [Gossypium australe]
MFPPSMSTSSVIHNDVASDSSMLSSQHSSTSISGVASIVYVLDLVVVQHDPMALVKNNTFDLVSSPADISLVGCKWLFKIKNSNGSVARNKVCLVAQGFLQAPGLDYHKTFSSMVKANTVITIFALVMSRKWKLC